MCKAVLRLVLLLLWALLGCSEEELYNFLATVVPNILDLRVIKDKFTGGSQDALSVAAASVLMLLL
jgi:hypothetical protein